MPKYEIIVYNAHVRNALDKQQPNETGLADNWAENNYIMIEAKSLAEARSIAATRYSAEMGFVVVDDVGS
jgi:hypothetical protein